MLRSESYSGIEVQFNEVFRRKPSINYVYLSIGSKLNSPIVHLPGHTNASYANSDMQMIPIFMRHLNLDQPSPFDMLMVIWDVFSSDEQILKNRQIMDNICKQHTNIHYILLNKLCIKDDLDRFIPFLTQKIIDHQIPSTNYMIANYVCFKNTPNTIERISEMTIPTAIQEILDREEFCDYKNCFYQWFGYNQYLYNFIYCYRSMYRGSVHFYNVNAIERIVRNEYLNASGNTTVIQDTNMINIMSNMYDLSNTNRLSNQTNKSSTTVSYHVMSLLETLCDANAIFVPNQI